MSLTNTPKYVGRLAVVVAILASVPASAQEGADDEKPSKAERAQKAFEKGVVHYQKGDYAEAIVDFRKGHSLVPNPTFLVNVAMAQMHLGQPKKFLDTVEELSGSEEELGDEDVAKVRALGDGGRAALRARSVAEDVEKQREDRKDGTTDQREPRADETGEERPTGGFGGLGWAGIASMAAGVGGVAGAGILSAQLSEDWNELERLRTRPGSRDAFEEKQDEIKSKQTLGQILLYAGSGVAAVGTGLLVYELVSPPGSSGTRAHVTFTPNGRFVLNVEW